MAERALPLRVPRPRALAQAAAIPLWEWGFAVLGLFLCLDAGVRTLRILNGTESPIGGITSPDVDYSQGSPLTQVLLFGVYCVSLVLLMTCSARQLKRALTAKLIWALPALAMVSILWSGAPTISFRRAVALVGSAIFGLYLATRFPRLDLLRAVLATSVIATALSLLTVVALPAYAIDDTGAWQGVFSQKNQFGRFMALSAVLWLLYALSVRKHRLLAGATAVCVVLVLLSKSATALGVFVILLGALGLVRLLRAHSGLATPVLILALVGIGYLITVAVHDPGQITRLLGRDSSLTGRTELWSLVWQQIRTRPLLGFGYGGFWLGFDGPSAAIWNVTDWNPPSAHDGYLDLLLDLGIAGMALFVATMLVALRYAFALARRGRTLDAVFPLIFLLFYLVSDITESFLVAYNTISWVLFVAVTIQLHMWWREEGGVRAPATHRRTPRPFRALPSTRRSPAAPTQERIHFQEEPPMAARVTVSAIMPTFNAMPHVREAIESVLAQTLTDWELIVVDAGSTDGTTDLLARYDDPRIRFFDLGETMSPAAARNIALDFAAGKYIAFVESEAISAPTRFATEVGYLERHKEVHIVASQVTFAGHGGQPAVRSRYPEEPEAIQKRLAHGEMALPFSTAMIRAWCFERFGKFREDMGRMDALEWCLRVRRNCNFRVLPDALCQYRHGTERVMLRQWLDRARYERYAMYRAGTFGTNVNGAALSYDRFARRWQTRLALSTLETLRFASTRLRSTIGGRKLT